jgi:nucleoside-diphosphate-sugar epimerase
VIRLVLTGASGFLGAGVLQYARASGLPVLALGRNLPARAAALGPGVETASWDLAGDEGPGGLRAGDTVVHCAALLASGTPDPALLDRVNRRATLTLAREAIRAGAEAFVFVSSVSAHGPWGSAGAPLKESSPFRPVSAYGASKARAEEDLAALDWAGTRLLVLRPGVIHGPGCNPASSAGRLLRGLSGRVFLRSGGGRAPVQLHQPTEPGGRPVPSAGAGTTAHGRHGGPAFLVREEPCPTMAQFQDRILAVYGRRPWLLPAPRRLLEPLGRLGDELRSRHGWHFPLSRETVAGFTGSGFFCSIDKARAFGWMPAQAWEESLADTARQWLQSRAESNNP